MKIKNIILNKLQPKKSLEERLADHTITEADARKEISAFAIKSYSEYYQVCIDCKAVESYMDTVSRMDTERRNLYESLIKDRREKRERCTASLFRTEFLVERYNQHFSTNYNSAIDFVSSYLKEEGFKYNDYVAATSQVSEHMPEHFFQWKSLKVTDKIKLEAERMALGVQATA